MTQRDQARIVKELTSSIASTIIDDIMSGKIPADWDGLELRELIAEKADDSRATSMRDKRTQRKRDYNNTVLVNNL